MKRGEWCLVTIDTPASIGIVAALPINGRVVVDLVDGVFGALVSCSRSYTGWVSDVRPLSPVEVTFALRAGMGRR